MSAPRSFIAVLNANIVFVVKLLQGSHSPLYLAAEHPTVTWVAEVKLAMTFKTRALALEKADRMRSYGTVGVEPRHR